MASDVTNGSVKCCFGLRRERGCASTGASPDRDLTAGPDSFSYTLPVAAVAVSVIAGILTGAGAKPLYW
jgi:hypothetical protein